MLPNFMHFISLICFTKHITSYFIYSSNKHSDQLKQELYRKLVSFPQGKNTL